MTEPKEKEGYFLGIDIGTQGLTVLLTDANDLSVHATGEASYGFVKQQTPQVESTADVKEEEDEKEGCCYEQNSTDWEQALVQAIAQIRNKFKQQQHSQTNPLCMIRAIGIAGQMHGEVLVDAQGAAIDPVRLWCDGRNAAEAQELTEALATKCPQRMTAVRFLWTARHQPDRAAATAHLTTPAGWLAYRLTGQFCLGVGDAAGMFPVHEQEKEETSSASKASSSRSTSTAAATGRIVYHSTKLERYNQILAEATKKYVPKDNGEMVLLQDLLPKIRLAGEDAGSVTEQGARLLLQGLYGDHNDESLDDDALTTINNLVGVPVASAEGDQVSALAGSLIGSPGTVACSFGTSVCANVVADDASTAKPFVGVSPAIDHFCAADGRPIHMVWLRNGTTFFNSTVSAFTQHDNNESTGEAFARLMPKVLDTPPDCGGLLAMPFMDDEPGLQVRSGPSSALLLGWTAQNAQSPGNAIKASLLSTIFNLKTGVQVLQEQGVVELRKIVLSGGLVKSPEMGQIVADVFDCPVQLLAAADEGSSWGAAVMAAYRYNHFQQEQRAATATTLSWKEFLQHLATQRPNQTSYTPHPDHVKAYARVYTKYQKLLVLEGSLRDLQRDE